MKTTAVRYLYGQSGANYRRLLPCPFCDEKIYNTEFEHHIFGYASGKPAVCAASREAYPEGMTNTQFKGFLAAAIKKADQEEKESAPAETPAPKKRGRPPSTNKKASNEKEKEKDKEDEGEDPGIIAPKRSSPDSADVPSSSKAPTEEEKEKPKIIPIKSFEKLSLPEPPNPQPPREPARFLEEIYEDSDQEYEDLFGNGSSTSKPPENPPPAKPASEPAQKEKEKTSKIGEPGPSKTAPAPTVKTVGIKAPSTSKIAPVPRIVPSGGGGEAKSAPPTMLPATFLSLCGLCGNQVASPTLLYLPCCYRQATCFWCVMASTVKPGGVLKCNQCKFSLIPPPLS